MSDLTGAQIAEYMAFDRLKDEEYRKSLESKVMTDEERNAQIIKLFGGRRGNNK